MMVAVALETHLPRQESHVSDRRGHRPRGAAAIAMFVAAAAVVTLEPGCSRGPTVPAKTNASVLRVVDGDTVDVRTDDRGRLRIRVIGIDTPEAKKPHYTVGCGGMEASHYAEALLTGQRVAVVTDPSQDARDRYGRTLAEIFLPDGRNYAVETTRAGHAHSYVYGHRPSMWAAQIADAERQAQKARVGIWGPPCFGHTESVPTRQVKAVATTREGGVRGRLRHSFATRNEFDVEK